MAKYVLTITSKSGKRLDGCTGNSTSIAVYDDTDLKQRLRAAKQNPDLKTNVRKTK